MVAVEHLPREAWLRAFYLANYYGLGKLGWKLYGKRPINPDLTWDSKSKWNRAFRVDGGLDPNKARRSGEGFDSNDDENFVRLRLQGPNPFMLKATGRKDPSTGTHEFVLDFTPFFVGLFPSTTALFVVDESRATNLRATEIQIGDLRHTPGSEDWEMAKRVVNALDARYAAFIRHLLNTHLIVGQAFAVAAYSLPVWHRLRPFMDFFTYGTLQVNHFAYNELLSADSYFIRSNFVSIAEVKTLMANAIAEFDFDEWIVPKDIEKREISRILKHPYEQDACTIWPAIEECVVHHLERLEIDDAFVDDDPHLAGWYASIRQALPPANTKKGHCSQVPKHLTSREQLRDLMAALIYNNVSHEVCGNLAPILESLDRDDKTAISFDNLRAMADPDRSPAEPSAADVFLMDQAGYVSSFNVIGNRLLNVDAPKYIDDPRLVDAVEELQKKLRALDTCLKNRNEDRAIPFSAMEPEKWEASISF